MAHLLSVGGASKLVTRIAHERNNAFVRELADEPELLHWLAAAGLTVEEAAQIQPSYCSTNSAIVCGGTFSWRQQLPQPATGVLEVVVTTVEAAVSVARVDAVYGNTGTIAVGDQVVVEYPRSATARFLVPLFGDSPAADAGRLPAVGEGLNISPDGIIRTQVGSNEGHPLTTAQIAEAFLAPDCAAHLAQRDAWWSKGTCDGATDGATNATDGGTNKDGGGCSTAFAADGSAATIQILLALVGVISARRVSRAARRLK